MGKKYIIEIEDKPFHKGNGDFLYRVKGFNSLVFDMTGIGMLTPYTALDLEQVRKEAYEQGLNDAEKGKASCQFCEYELYSDRVDPCRICACNYTNFFEPKKQEKEEQIQIGDEVISPNGKGVVTEITDIYMRIMYAKGSGQVVKSEDLTKTGRHFPEIAEVLQKMKEADNG